MLHGLCCFKVLCVVLCAVRTSGGEQFLSAVMGGGRGGATGHMTRNKVESGLAAERHLSAPALTIDDGHASASPLDDQFFDMLIRCQVLRCYCNRSLPVTVYGATIVLGLVQ
jgi:hypothetical protein